jgi:ABC-type multidrug transport system ATPase subunit
MSELLLDALMQLFALLTDFDKESKNQRAHGYIKDYLERQYNVELSKKYLDLYNEYLNAFHGSDFLQEHDWEQSKKKADLKRISSLCEKLNQEMEKAPKVLLFVLLLEFLLRCDSVGTTENEMIDVLAKKLKIDPADYLNLKPFVLGDAETIGDLSSLLIISGDKARDKQAYKHIYNPKQQVVVWMLRINSTSSFIFKYSGGRNLYLNGYNIEQDRIYVFASGSVIKTSLMPPIYYGRVNEMFLEQRNKSRIVYKAIEVEHKFNPKLIGVHKFSLVGRSGQLIGIIGGSGTGKSTLLNVLNGNLKLSNGKITINGFDLKTEKEHLEGVIGYVPQVDLLIEELTVYENLYYNARLCFSKLPESELKQLVAKALDDFDLAEAKDLVVGSPLKKTLSGGQRKRLNIALELIRQPSILFVDEPTSGLSSMDSEKVMTLLKRQTVHGRLVIINIHQPSSDLYKLFDKLLIIDKGGRVIHNGNPMDAIVYFKRMAHYVNPEERECQTCGNVKTEQPLRIIEARKVTPDGRLVRERKITPQAWYNYYRINFEDKFKWKETAAKDKKEKLPPNLFSIPSRWEQFRIYFSRDALSKLKDRQYLLINFLEGPLLALILGFFTKYMVNAGTGGGYVFAENVNIPAYLFMCVVVALFLGLNVSAEEIIKDRKLLQRESFLNLSRFSYLSAKIVVLFLISAIQTFTFVLIGNSILEIQGLTLSYWLILFSVACFANMLGLNISSGLNSVVSIYISIPLILVPQMLFSGVIVEFDKLHSSIANDENVPVIGDIMTSRWGYEALAVNQFMNNAFEKHFFELEQQMSTCSFNYGYLIPELMMRNNEARYALDKIRPDDAAFHLGVLNKQLFWDGKTLQLRAYGIPESTFRIDDYQAGLHDRLKVQLDSLSKTEQLIYSALSRQKDSIYQHLLTQLGSSEALLQFKQAHYNKNLAQWVLAKNEPRQIVFDGEKYIRKKHPVYKNATHRWGRAHFYAPFKHLGDWVFPTPWFNVAVIWLMTLTFFVTLYFDFMRRTIAYFERFKLRRLYSRWQKLPT